MTPPLNFSGVPQQPQAMPPYGINQPPQRMPQQPMMYQQFGVVPDSFQGQQPMMVSNAPMMRSGRANLALKNQQLQDQIDTLENQPLPAGGNPVGVGALAVGAAGATAVGASEVAYRWDLDKKLAHEHNGREIPATPLTDTEKAEIRAKAEQAKLTELNDEAVKKHFATNEKTIKSIVNDALTIEDAIGKQTASIQALGTTPKDELSALQAEKRLALSKVIDDTATAPLSDLEAKIQALKTATQPTRHDAWIKESKRLDGAVNKAETSITEFEKAKKQSSIQIDAKKKVLALEAIQELENKAFGAPSWTEKNHSAKSAKFRDEWVKEAKAFFNDPTVDSIDPKTQPKYMEFLTEKINERKFKKEEGIQYNETLKDGKLKAFEEWKADPANSAKLEKPVDLQKTYDDNRNLKQLEAKVTESKQKLIEARQQRTKAEGIRDDYKNSDKSKPHLEYQEKLEQRDKIATIEKEHTARVKQVEATHTKALTEAKNKLTQLEGIKAKQPSKITKLTSGFDTTNVEAEVLRAEEKALANKSKGKVPDLFATDAEAKGFGKAWQNVDDLKAKGFTELAEHSKGAKGVGWKAGALVGVIGAGLTLQQFFAAGKAQEANAAKEAKLAQLRQQQADLGG